MNATTWKLEFREVVVPDDFSISPREFFDRYAQIVTGKYYSNFFVDERSYYIVEDFSGIDQCGGPEGSASIIVDGRSGEILKGFDRVPRSGLLLDSRDSDFLSSSNDLEMEEPLKNQELAPNKDSKSVEVHRSIGQESLDLDSLLLSEPENLRFPD